MFGCIISSSASWKSTSNHCFRFRTLSMFELIGQTTKQSPGFRENRLFQTWTQPTISIKITLKFALADIFRTRFRNVLEMCSENTIWMASAPPKSDETVASSPIKGLTRVKSTSFITLECQIECPRCRIKIYRPSRLRVQGEAGA